MTALERRGKPPCRTAAGIFLGPPEEETGFQMTALYGNICGQSEDAVCSGLLPENGSGAGGIAIFRLPYGKPV